MAILAPTTYPAMAVFALTAAVGDRDVGGRGVDSNNCPQDQEQLCKSHRGVGSESCTDEVAKGSLEKAPELFRASRLDGRNGPTNLETPNEWYFLV